MELRRPGKESNRIALFTLLMVGFAVWNIRTGLSDDIAWSLGFGAFFAAWALFLGLTLVRRAVMGRITDDGVTLRYVTHSRTISWDEMRWARLDPSGRAGLIAYRRAGGSRDRFAPFSMRAMGQENAEALRQAVLSARPDLPESAAAAETGDTKGDPA